MENSPQIKPEYSPAESFLSAAGDSYPPLFQDSTMNPLDAMTPRSFDNYDDNSIGGSMDGSMAGTPAPEKKPVKKRKSWGQQLPEPKTNLPPRKRAKTEDEKEQRRVERVLRNRRAAQSSRERKRQEVEALEAEKLLVEQRNEDLMRRLAAAEAKNAELQQQLERVAAGNAAMTVFGSSAASSPAASDHIRQSPRKQSPTFSQALFGSASQETPAISTESLVPEPIPQTVNPASLSPEMRPVEFDSNASSTDLTQLPAVSIGRAEALDDFNPDAYLAGSGLADVESNFDFSFFQPPDATGADTQFFENKVAPLTVGFHLDNDNMAFYNDGVSDDTFNEFLNHDDQPTAEIYGADKLAETTANTQPAFGAASSGRDVEGTAISV